MHIEIARKLREHLSQHPFGFPTTQNELEIHLIDHLFTEAEAELALQMTPRGESPEDIAKKYGKSLDEVLGLLESMASKGAVYREWGKFSLAGYIPGIYEFQVKRLNEDLAKLLASLGRAWIKEVFGASTPWARIIPAESSLPVGVEIAPFERAKEIVESASSIALTDCICRTQSGILKKPCSRPRDEICIILNGWADYFVNKSFARKVTVDEAMKALVRGENAGLVRETTNMRNDAFFMCQCCSCCCNILRSLGAVETSTVLVKSNYIPSLNVELCTGCEECVKVCPTHAMSMDKGIAVHEQKRCIGCGLCVVECPSKAIVLKKKRSQEISVPPADFEELLTLIAYETGRTYWYK